ncbi:unnamed protein product [Cyclocybe aegerita]|uniref:Reverse transcriptase domain-containing protein n=1 Tax=Cyclocybe aegerita TaxID=1973307 RepID=A0A8S0W926_CYCAE|nr:unnamed protein product [Cyclocybe aegerita]
MVHTSGVGDTAPMLFDFFSCPNEACARPIVLLITFGKLIEKMIANRIQFDAVKHDIFHPNQLGSIRQRSTEDAGLILKGLQTSALAFDITQFFPSINHEMFMAVLRKQGFSPVLVEFFASYLVGRSTVYCWNTFQSDSRSADVGVGQGSALSPVISGLGATQHDAAVFVDDGTILAQSKQLDDNNVGLRKAYKIIYLLFVAFALVLEHDKTELFHFSRRRDAYNPSLDLGYAPHTGATPLKPKTYWRYLGFYFDRGLTFHEHVRYYATKAFTTVQAMRMLGNSTRGLSPKQRRLLYRSCVVPIATYGYRLWYFDGARNKGAMNQLKRMQRKAALWITGAFRTSPTGGLEALAGLIPVHLMLKKLATRAVYRIATLSDTHPLRSMMGEGLLKRAAPHARSAALMTPAMRGKVKSTVMEVDERVHTLTESFEPFAPEARPGDRLLDHYADRLHFDERDPGQDRRPYLDELIAKARADPLTVLAATDGSVPQSNQYQAASAAIIYKGHPVDNRIMSLAELPPQMRNSMPSPHRAVDPGVHSGQAFSLSVCRALQEWFEADDLRRITFVYVPSAMRWDIHGEAHKYVTELKVRVGCRKTDNSIDALRSQAAHSVLDSWNSTFQDPTYRGSEFLELQQPDRRPLQPSYLNGGPWLSTFGHSITEFARVCRCITGHAPIGAYYRRFKINEPHGCTCGAALQSRQHILFRCCDRYSVHYPRFLGDIASFMKYNPTAFGFNRDPSGSWWTDECLETFGVYQLSRSLADYNKFKKVCKDAKRDFFDERITEIATSHKRPWDLVEWVKQCKLPPCEAIRNGDQSCHDMDDLWDALHSTYNSASGREYDALVLDELPDEPVREWADFSEHELLSALKGCSNSSAPGPDHVTWVHLKELLKDKHVLALFIVLANACLRVGHWPHIFKESLSVIVLKLNKPSYAVLKAFRLIVLLITFGKLIEKMIANRIQFDAVKHDIFHPNQLGGICQRSTEDAGLILTHLVRVGWVKGLQTSTLAFDIAQFFPSINHEMFMAVLRKQGFSPVLVEFFASYLVGRSTVYCWNTFQSDSRSADVGVGQGSALSPVISGLFIAPVMKLFYIKAALLNTTLLSFVDDRTILAQSKQLDDNNVGLHKAYKIIYLLFVAFALVLEHDKTELFHFSRQGDTYNPSLDLGYTPHTGATPLKPKTYWRYLGFYFDRGLTFHEHVCYYATKAFTTVQAMCMLGNSTRGLSPKQRCLLYRSCVVPIATYGYHLWYFDGARNKGAMNQLKRMQRKAALWITGAFRTSPTGGLEALAGLIPVHLMLKKLAMCAVYRVTTLSDTHPLCSMMGEELLKRAAPHARSAALMTPAMRGKVKSTVMEVDERVHTLTESFKPFAPEARPGNRLLDRYADHLHFDECDPAQDRRPYLDELITKARADPSTVLAATDGSVPQSNQYQAASAAIIYKGHHKLERTHYVSGRVTAPDVELNAISSVVRLAVKQANCQHIMVFTDSMGLAHRAVDPSVHSGQAFSLSVCHALQEWFEADDLHRITFIHVPSALRWDIHGEAHKYVTEFKVRVGCRKMDNSIDALRSRAAHSVLDLWSSTFQDPTYRGSEFLELQQPDGRPLQPLYLNGGPWLSTFGHSITEFARVCWCITGHTPIGAYYRRFKINEPHGCTCRAALQSHQHILFCCCDRYSVHCPRFLGDIASFMKYNPTAFGFNQDPLGVG